MSSGLSVVVLAVSGPVIRPSAVAALRSGHIAVGSSVSAAKRDPGVSGDHRCWALVDGGDDLRVVDPAQVPGGDRQVRMPELSLDHE